MNVTTEVRRTPSDTAGGTSTISDTGDWRIPLTRDDDEPVPLDERGRLWLEPLNLRLAVSDDRVVCVDGVTGEEIGDYRDQVRGRRDAEARADAAEARAEVAERTLREFEPRMRAMEEAIRKLQGG